MSLYAAPTARGPKPPRRPPESNYGRGRRAQQQTPTGPTNTNQQTTGHTHPPNQTD
jgi:hypothetical protein